MTAPSASWRCASPAPVTSTPPTGEPLRPVSTSSPPTTDSLSLTSWHTTTSTTTLTGRTTTTASSTTVPQCGAEGPTDDEDVLELRARQRRNLLGTLLLSAGVPMILGGGRDLASQDGNNNAYCQDNELSWYDWANADHDMLAFTRTAIALRKAHPALRPREYLRTPGGEPAQMVLYRPDGEEMSHQDWENQPANSLAVALDGRLIEDAEGETTYDRYLLLLNGHWEPVEFTIPVQPGALVPCTHQRWTRRHPRDCPRRHHNPRGPIPTAAPQTPMRRLTSWVTSAMIL